MIIITVDNKNIESALRTLKHKVQKTKLIQQLKSQKEFVKPSIVKRKIKMKAIYVNKLKNNL